MVTAIYPGTFDPITKGHIDLAQRATKLFEKVIVAVADNGNKETLFSLDERIALSEEVLSGHTNIEVKPFNDLVTNFAHQHKARVIIRGIRAVSDFDYEFQMAGMNARMDQDVQTVFLPASENTHFIASRFVKEIARLGGDIDSFVSPFVAKRIADKNAA